MSPKEQIIKQIKNLMQEHGITLSDLVTELDEVKVVSKKAPSLNMDFDLACIGHGCKISRYSFEIGRYFDPIGIFPFKDSPIYLFFDEEPMKQRLGLIEDSIPSIELWKNLFFIRKEINKKLLELKKPILEGCYFSEPKTPLNLENWVVEFKNEESCLLYDAYNNSKLAKVRYVGKSNSGF
jgi:hypothetical protein